MILLSTLSRVEALERSGANDKVAHMLFNLAERIGPKTQSHASSIKLPITQQDIADSLGLSRETAGIVLKRLEIRKLVQRSRQNYTLYTHKIKRYLDKR